MSKNAALQAVDEWGRHGLVANLPFVDGSELCAQVDGELFFPEKGRVDVARDAQKVCAHCPLELPCLDYAIHNPVDGIWGGTTLRERQAIAHSMGLPYGVVSEPLYAGPLPGERPEDFRDPDDQHPVGTTAAIRAWANRNGYSGYLNDGNTIPTDIQVAYWEALAAREEQAS